MPADRAMDIPLKPGVDAASVESVIAGIDGAGLAPGLKLILADGADILFRVDNLDGGPRIHLCRRGPYNHRFHSVLQRCHRNLKSRQHRRQQIINVVCDHVIIERHCKVSGSLQRLWPKALRLNGVVLRPTRCKEIKVRSHLALSVDEDILDRDEDVRLVEEGREIVVDRVHQRISIVVLVRHGSLDEIDEVNFVWGANTPMSGYGGIVNMGLTCYANAVIQCMRHCERIPWIFEKGRFDTLFKKGETRRDKQRMTVAFAEVIQMLESCKKGESVRPSEFWQTLRPCVKDTCFEHFAMRAPHDAHEFFIFLLDILHEALAQEVEMTITRTPDTPKDVRAIQALEVWKREFTNLYSPLVDLFYGLMHVRVECQTCKNTTHRWETFTSLKAAMPAQTTTPLTLAEMLNEEMKPEMIEGYDCEPCGAKTTAKKSLAIWRMPHTMVVVLKRFTPTGQKIGTPMMPVGAIDFTQHFSEESPEVQRDYSLRGIVDHHGGARGGHYTSQCKNADGEWTLYDDDGVRSLAGPLFGSSTYILFFHKL